MKKEGVQGLHQPPAQRPVLTVTFPDLQCPHHQIHHVDTGLHFHMCLTENKCKQKAPDLPSTRVWRVLSSNEASKLLPGLETPSETRKLRSLPPFPTWALLPPDHSSSHHSHHEENQANNDTHEEDGDLQRFCGRKERGPDLRHES